MDLALIQAQIHIHNCQLRKCGWWGEGLSIYSCRHKYLADTFVATTLAAVDTLLALKGQVERVLSGNWQLVLTY